LITETKVQIIKFAKFVNVFIFSKFQFQYQLWDALLNNYYFQILHHFLF